MTYNKKIIILICIFTIIGTTTYSQNNDSLIFHSGKFNRVVFITPDTSYNFIKYIYQTGQYSFSDRFIDSSYSYSNFYSRVEIKKKHFKAMQNVTEQYNYTYIPDIIDTIYSYFPIKKGLEIKEIDEVFNNVHYPHINIGEEVIYSDILKQLGEKSILNSDIEVIRILYPMYEFDQSMYEFDQCSKYQMVKIDFGTDTSILYSILLGDSKKLNGIQIIDKKIYKLSKSDVNKIKNRLSELNNPTDSYCRRPGNPYLFEYKLNSKYNCFFISYLGQRGKKEFNKINHFCNYLMSMNNKYKMYKSKTTTISDK